MHCPVVEWHCPRHPQYPGAELPGVTHAVPNGASTSVGHLVLFPSQTSGESQSLVLARHTYPADLGPHVFGSQHPFSTAQVAFERRRHVAPLQKGSTPAHELKGQSHSSHGDSTMPLPQTGIFKLNPTLSGASMQGGYLVGLL